MPDNPEPMSQDCRAHARRLRGDRRRGQSSATNERYIGRFVKGLQGLEVVGSTPLPDMPPKPLLGTG